MNLIRQSNFKDFPKPKLSKNPGIILNHLKPQVKTFDAYEIRELSVVDLYMIEDMNSFLFNESRIINQYDHRHLIILMLIVGGIKAGFKIGYGHGNGVFYSAKGGVMPAFRRRGFARQLTVSMMQMASQLGYERFEFDSFPKRSKEMLIMGLSDGFLITDAEWNRELEDFRIRLSVSISDYLNRFGSQIKNVSE